MTESRGEIPKKIDRYEIIEAVGFGAMGAVYKAFDPLIKRPVAVKTLRLDVPPQSPDYRAFLDRFATEARTAGRLSHPNVITLYDVGHTDDQVPWLAMEFVEGQTVAELLEGERLRAEVVVGLVSQIAAAIDYAHSEGVIHRDIKPSNVIVYSGEKVKVTDFGIAKLMDAEITQSGLMMGTPSYMSPEQAMGEELDGRTDIFSLGVVAFEMLSGQQPFPGNNVTSILYKLVHSDPVHPDDLEVLGLLPDKWHQVFSRVLAKDPVERFGTAADFVEQLEHCLGNWFGALEGETVIIKDPASLGADETVTTGAPPDATPAGTPPGATPAGTPPDAKSDVSSSDETLVAGPPEPTPVSPSPPAPDPTLDGATTTLERDVALLADASDETITDVSSGEETVYVPPPKDDAEKTLYAAPDATSPGFADAGDETLLDPKTVRRRRAAILPLGRKQMLAMGLGALALLVLATVIVVGGREAPTPPEPVAIPEPPPFVVDSGTLNIVTDPEGATVTIDGEERGLTPLELEDMPLEVYELQIQRDGFHPEELSAELTTEAPTATVELTLRPEPPKPPPPAYFRIRSTPEGANVEVDGNAVGDTPTDRFRVRAGNRTVRVLADGFLPWEDSVRARSGQTIDVDAILTPRPQAEPVIEEPPPPPPPPVVEPGTLVERGEPGVRNPKCIECPAVRYPEAARRSRLEGVVELSFVIDETGAVQDVQVRQSAGEIFDNAVVETVRNWRYEPATKRDVPVKIRWVQLFRFRQGR